QLMSRALGGEVKKNPVKEIGWNPVRIEDTPTARRWFGEDLAGFTTFQWHGETFSIPPGGERILTGPHCANQAYVVGDRHLGLQCHIEMTPEMIASWLESAADEVAESLSSPAVQDARTIQSQIPQNLAKLSATADRLYMRWISNLRR
ncbi:MAG TPA: type 1 glutamine amidotransferase, partial [Usitatibacter sp.]|nr:type 1 glutamine amidotransferase [Usitatibacter sp.]